MATGAESFTDLCKHKAATVGDRVAYILTDGDEETLRLTFSDLDADARIVARSLHRRGLRGERVLMLLDSVDFLRAFYGCLYNKTVAVPLNLPTRRTRIDRIQAVAADAGAQLAVTSDRLAASLRADGLELNCVSISDLLEEGANDTGEFEDPELGPDDPAFFQYTSGSTGTPKGVIVTHGNLLANQQMIAAGFGHDERTVFVGWLPLFHDMGLVGNVLQPMFLGITSVLMPPSAFTQRPRRWLELITRYGATTSGAPNFAYELCLRRIREQDLDGLDLSSWTVAFNGAEPVRATTLRRFEERFSRCGFRKTAFYPCYGMAEATLFITGPQAHGKVAVREVDTEALMDGKLVAPLPDATTDLRKQLVGCGRAWLDEALLIVDPQTREVLEDGKVGEIWVSGPNVAKGYWRSPVATEETFGALTRDGRGPFLRTGDLGAVADGQLFVTGRIKDVIIVAGKNHYPQDIEQSVAACHPAFDGRPGAAFSLGSDGKDEVAVVQEVGRKFLACSDSELQRRIREVVFEEHGLFVRKIALIGQHALPLTTSGKVQRTLCRKMLLSDEFREVLAGQPSARAV